MCRHYIHAQVGQALFAAFDVEQLLIVHMIMQCPSLNSAQMLKHKYTYEQNFFEIRTTFHEKTHALTNTHTHTNSCTPSLLQGRANGFIGQAQCARPRFQPAPRFE